MKLIHFAHTLTSNVEGFISSHDVDKAIISEFKIDSGKPKYEIIQMSQTTIEVSNGSRKIVTTLLVDLKD